MVSKAFITRVFAVIALVTICPVKARAYGADIPITSLTPVRNRVMKHFDQNKDHVLNYYENALYRMYLQFRFPLAKDKKMQFFDQNKNLMLEAYEYKNYLKDKQAHFKSYRIAVQKMKIQRKYRKQQQGRSL